MIKDIVISILAAVILQEHPWMSAGTMEERIVIIMGLAVVLFIFLLFLEEMVEKAMRVRKIRQILNKLRSLKIRGTR